MAKNTIIGPVVPMQRLGCLVAVMCTVSFTSRAEVSTQRLLAATAYEAISQEMLSTPCRGKVRQDLRSRMPQHGDKEFDQILPQTVDVTFYRSGNGEIAWNAKAVRVHRNGKPLTDKAKLATFGEAGVFDGETFFKRPGTISTSVNIYRKSKEIFLRNRIGYSSFRLEKALIYSGWTPASLLRDETLDLELSTDASDIQNPWVVTVRDWPITGRKLVFTIAPRLDFLLTDMKWFGARDGSGAMTSQVSFKYSRPQEDDLPVLESHVRQAWHPDTLLKTRHFDQTLSAFEWLESDEEGIRAFASEEGEYRDPSNMLDPQSLVLKKHQHVEVIDKRGSPDGRPTSWTKHLLHPGKGIPSDVLARLPFRGKRRCAPRSSLIARRAFSVPQSRRIEVPLYIPPKEGKRAIVHAAIEHGYDDSGDRGAYLSLLASTNGAEMGRVFSKTKGYTWLNATVKPGRYLLVVEDEDTSFEGKNPGNCGMIAAWVVWLPVESDTAE
jgi:hypothetical protein